jgi:5-methylcytosine-specific restriction protein B
MNLQQLADKLVEMYQNADTDKSAMVHLFGIRYADEIHKSGYNANDIIKSARLRDGTLMSDSYKTEISKGINLSKYVVEKQTIIDFINRSGVRV